MNDAEIKLLSDALYAGKVRRARAAPAHLKMGWGAELFSEACTRMRCGIRAQFPAFDDAAVETTLRRRLKRLRQVAEYGIFQPASRA